jgi:hypothetical protein
MSSIRLQPVDLSLTGWTPTTLQADNAENAVGDDAKRLRTPLNTLTTETVDGTGAFDVLMRATKKHLQEEFENQRITGSEYATVYLGALAAVLQTSIQFLLNEQQVNQIAAEIGLIRQKTVTELAQTDDSIPQGLGFNFVPKIPVAIPPITNPGVPN